MNVQLDGVRANRALRFGKVREVRATNFACFFFIAASYANAICARRARCRAYRCACCLFRRGLFFDLAPVLRCLCGSRGLGQ